MEGNFKVCAVCGGAGGWKVKDKGWYEENYHTCPICDNAGFVPDNGPSIDEPALLIYNKYRKRITEAIERNSDLISCFSDDYGKKIDITFIPKSMFEFSKVARMLLIFGHRHSKINVNIKQQFYYDPNGDKVQFNINLTVECKESIEDIEGLIEIMEGEVLTLGTGMYKKSKGK